MTATLNPCNSVLFHINKEHALGFADTSAIKKRGYGDGSSDGARKNFLSKALNPLAMEATPWHSRLLLAQSISNSSAGPHRTVSGFLTVSNRHCHKNPGEFFRVHSSDSNRNVSDHLSSASRSKWHSGGGCCQLRFSDLTDMKCWTQRQRILPCNLSRRWCIYKSTRVRCAASREEDGGRQPRSFSQEVEVVDHYKVLGLRRQATASAIKLAYRQLARQLHPDVNKDADANEKFMSVRLAYEVLSDEESRKVYDNSLQEQAKTARRKQVYQRRERDTWLRNRSHSRRAPSASSEWSYSVYEYSNMESYYYTYPSSTSGTFSKKKKNTSNRGKSREADVRQRDWQVELQNIGKEALLFVWVVSAMWHALGAQTALGLLVGSLALWKDFAVGYRLASGIAWLMGGEKGLVLMVALIVTTRVLGRSYHGVAAIVSLAIWLGGGVLRAVPLPHGAILVLVYKCIQLQSESSL